MMFLDRTHLGTTHLVGFIWMSDHAYVETFYQTTYNRQTSIPLAVCQLTILAKEGTCTQSLD
jgi:hypothetical protein